MNTKPEYKTKQKEEILEYLTSIPGEHFTISDICDYFKSKGRPIGQTTVYRQIDRMIGEGLVNKYIIDANSPACFEYMGSDSHVDNGICFHCKCEKCGKLIHLHCDELDEIMGHMKEEHHFRVDPRRTVFYGLCEECSIGH